MCPSIIIMDNASHHKCLPEKSQNVSKVKKQTVVQLLCENRISFIPGITSVDAKELLKS